MIIKTKLKKYMHEHMIRVDWLSSKTGISKQSISNYRSGKVEPSKVYKKTIANALEVDESVIF